MLELEIHTQSTPNPDARKYIMNFDVKRNGRVSYVHPHECTHVPLANSLLNPELKIQQVHFFQKALTITKDEQQDWGSLDPKIQQIIRENFADHDPDFQEQSPQDQKNFSVEMKLIDAILDREIRPFLQADGGDVQLIDYQNNILTIRYQGACGGCPSSQMGTLEAITNLLKAEYDPKIEVVTV